MSVKRDCFVILVSDWFLVQD